MISAVIVGAGRGQRIGSGIKKQFIKLKGKSILWYSCQPFLQIKEIGEVVVVLPEDNIGEFEGELKDGPKKFKTVIGGETRHDSVFEGIKATSMQSHIVVIHDAVRPLIRPEIIRKALITAKRGKNVIVAVPLKDTIKKVESEKVVTTIERSNLWAAQTPQVFPKDNILRAYNKANEDGQKTSDDAGLCERLGLEIEIVLGSYDNIKITTQEDLRLAEKLIETYN